MGFRNPITSLSASQITPGTLGPGVELPADQLAPGTLSNLVLARSLVPGAVTAPAIAAGAVGADAIAANAIDGKVITGATLRTAAAGKRMEIVAAGSRIDWHPGGANNTPGSMTVESVNTGGSRYGQVVLAAPHFDDVTPGSTELRLRSLDRVTAANPSAVLSAGASPVDLVVAGGSIDVRKTTLGAGGSISAAGSVSGQAVTSFGDVNAGGRVRSTWNRNAPRRWVGARNSDGTAGAGSYANNVALSVTAQDLRAGVYLLVGYHRLGQNTAAGTVQSWLYMPAIGAVPTQEIETRRTVAASSYCDERQSITFVLADDYAGANPTFLLREMTSAGSVTAFSGSYIELTRLGDW